MCLSLRESHDTKAYFVFVPLNFWFKIPAIFSYNMQINKEKFILFSFLSGPKQNQNYRQDEVFIFIRKLK